MSETAKKIQALMEKSTLISDAQKIPLPVDRERTRQRVDRSLLNRSTGPPLKTYSQVTPTFSSIRKTGIYKPPPMKLIK